MNDFTNGFIGIHVDIGLNIERRKNNSPQTWSIDLVFGRGCFRHQIGDPFPVDGYTVDPQQQRAIILQTLIVNIMDAHVVSQAGLRLLPFNKH